jgi:hypothetical protein
MSDNVLGELHARRQNKRARLVEWREGGSRSLDEGNASPYDSPQLDSPDMVDEVSSSLVQSPLTVSRARAHNVASDRRVSC